MGHLDLWRVGLQGRASARRQGGPHAAHPHSYRKRQGEEATVATQSTPPPCMVYTAGSCEQDPGPGGWVYVQVSDGTAREESGEHPNTTSLRMELTAAIKALEATVPGSTVLVHTSSQLVQQGMTGWVHHGWHGDSSQLVENEDLWEKLRHLDEERHVRWERLDVPMAEATDGQPWHHVHPLLDAERHQATVHTPGAQAGSQADETGIRVTIEETEREAHMQHMEPILRARQGTQPSTGDRQQALMAEGQTLEQRWAVVHEEVLHLDQEWQRLLSILTNQVEAGRNGQSPSWADGALMFYDIDKHAARMSSLAQEALQMCHHYALTLQRMLDAMAEG